MTLWCKGNTLLIAVSSTTFKEVTVDSPRGLPGLALRVDREVTHSASWSCGSCMSQDPPGACKPSSLTILRMIETP